MQRLYVPWIFSLFHIQILYTLAIRDVTQHYDPSQNVLNIHIVPHTHDDVGWLKTVEQYYYGQNNTIRHACVSCILDSIIYALQRNPERKFTYVEMAFFSMWWEEQPEDIKQVTRSLVKNGQLSFANGGWCMHDEATTHFMGMIDQTTLGHDFLKREFDYIPTVGWQLDPFGHSATQASLLTSEMGFDALYIGRIDYQDLENRYESRSCEGIWDSSPNLRDNAIFWGLTGSFNGNYGAPEGFCFDILCDDDPLYGMTGNILHERVLDFLKSVQQQTERTRGNNVMLTMGSDFQFENALFNFKSLDLLIDQINTMDNVTISNLFPNFDGIKAFYSNPEIYTSYRWREYSCQDSRLHTDHGGLDIKKYDDFFPYSDCDHCFWTGYFTSRPALKYLERVGSSFLQAVRQVQTLYSDGTSGFREIELLEKGVAIAQHHDGVSGTSKQHVAYDYAKKIQEGINEASTFMASVLKTVVFGNEADSHELKFCQLRNESVCEISQRETEKEAGNFFVVIYNALVQKRSEIVSMPVSRNTTYVVKQYIRTNEYGGKWLDLPNVLFPNFNYAKIQGAAPFNLLIEVNDLDPVSPCLIVISFDDSFRKVPDGLSTEHPAVSSRRSLRSLSSLNTEQNFIVQQGDTEVQFANGLISKLSNKYGEVILTSEWGYYQSWSNYQYSSKHQDKKVSSFFAEPASGAYIFRPDVPEAEFHKLRPIPSEIHIYQSSITTEVHTTFEGRWLHQITKLYNQKDYVDIEFTVGPIPIHDGVGKEIVNRIHTSIANNGTFYTDSNGREFMKRQRSQRQTWSLREFEPVAGNYYPVNTAIFIEDDSMSVSILTDRSKGGSSLVDGCVELMAHRRIVQDDSRGVGEALNETESVSPYPPYGDASRQGEGLIVSGKHRVAIGYKKSGAKMARKEMDSLFSSLQVFTGKGTDTRAKYDSIDDAIVVGDMPANLQLLTLKLTGTEGSKKYILLRLGHAYGKNECEANSVMINIDLADLFPRYVILNIQEKTLSGNQETALWQFKHSNWTFKEPGFATYHEGTVISINPMEIKTYTLVLEMK